MFTAEYRAENHVRNTDPVEYTVSQERVDPVPDPPAPPRRPLDFQQRAVAHVLGRPAAIISAPSGLGKTRMAVEASRHALDVAMVDRVLVLAAAHSCHHWTSTISDLIPERRVTSAYGKTLRERNAVYLDHATPFVVVSYGLADRDTAQLTYLATTALVVLDDVGALTNPAARCTQSARAIATAAAARLGVYPHPRWNAEQWEWLLSLVLDPRRDSPDAVRRVARARGFARDAVVTFVSATP